MANLGIREYDAKRMFFESIGEVYEGKKVMKISDFDSLSSKKIYVIKPDQLFGKRGKLGLIGVKLSLEDAKKWFEEKSGTQLQIKNNSGVLDTFLVEEFIPHADEYYVAIKQEREYDEIFFSNFGGIDVEENWEKVISLQVGVGEKIDDKKISEAFHITDEKILKVILQLFSFYRNEDFTYLEVNPFCFDERNGNLILLDMVAKIDNTAFFLHPDSWKDLEFPNSFGFEENARERYISELDQKTGASLKLKFLNTSGKIWTLLSGGGGSLVMTDTLGYLGCAPEIANYGELSGDPDRFYTREYTRTLFEQMLESPNPKYLIIAGAIANFTQIDKTFTGIIDVLEEKAEEIRKKGIQVLVRRGGLNDKLGLKLLSEACQRLNIPCRVADGSVYMTDILKEIKL